MPRPHTANALCIAASFILLTAAAAADKPNLSGTWKMNPAKSEAGSSEIKSRIDKIEHQDPQLKITTTQDDENGHDTKSPRNVHDRPPDCG